MKMDGSEDVRNLQKKFAKDKSDQQLIMRKMQERIEDNFVNIKRHANNFDVLASGIAILAENVNLQMESEFADIVDKNLTALYGAKPLETEVGTKGKRVTSTLLASPQEISDQLNK